MVTKIPLFWAPKVKEPLATLRAATQVNRVAFKRARLPGSGLIGLITVDNACSIGAAY